MTVPICVAAALILLAPPALADEPTHDLSVAVGATYLSRTDLSLSQRNQRGVLPRVELGWDWRRTGVMHKANVGFAIGSYRTQPSFEYARNGVTQRTGPSVITMVNFQYAFGKRIDGENWTLHVGATSANQAQDMTFVNGFLGTSNYLGAFELGPWVDLRLALGERHALGFEAWTPAVAWMGRNPYSVHSAEHIYNTRDNNTVNTIARHIADGSLQSVNHYQAAHTRAAWRAELSPHFTLQTRVRFDWLHYAKPAPLVELQLGADASIHWRF